jgi:hypothetical protein
MPTLNWIGKEAVVKHHIENLEAGLNSFKDVAAGFASKS